MSNLDQKVIKDAELIIYTKRIEEIKAQHGVWGSLCQSASMCLGLKVVLGPRQIEELFYRIWEAVGDERLSQWIEAEGYEALVKTDKS